MDDKKNIVSQEAVTQYIPPRLVKSQQGWYVVYYHQVAGVWTRERKSFNLNRIRDKRQRQERAREIVEQLKDSLSARPQATVDHEDSNALGRTPIIEAIRFAVKLVNQSPKKETRRSFSMIEKMLVEFIQQKKFEHLGVAQFTVKYAQAFLDAAVQRGISNTTFNNYRGFATTLFNRLVKRDYIRTNPFSKIEMLEREEKGRRPFTPEERNIVLTEIYQTDYWLFILVLMHFLCLIRRTECYRMRFSNFNLKDSYIHLPRTTTKNSKTGDVTIPDEMRVFLLDERFSRQPANYLLFGKKAQPHPSISAGENTFKRRHRVVLQRLQQKGLLTDITGLSLYSWKDTGMTEFAKFLRPLELRDHARHASIDQSLEYYHADRVIASVKSAKIGMETE